MKLETWERQEIVKLNPHGGVRNGILNAGGGERAGLKQKRHLLDIRGGWTKDSRECQ